MTEHDLSADKEPFIEVSVKDDINIIKAIEDFIKMLIACHQDKMKSQIIK